MLDLYFKYRRVITRFRSGALGNEIDHIAADLSKAGFKRDSAKLYLARHRAIQLVRNRMRLQQGNVDSARNRRPVSAG